MELELNKIYQGDCLELMKSIPDKSIDLVLTDPPYGIGIKGKVGGEKLAKVTDYGDFNNRDNNIPSKEYFDEIIRISKHCIIFGGNYFIENLTNSSCWIVWDKDNSGNFADCELARTNFNTAVRKIKIRWNGMLQDDMKDKEIRYHPTQNCFLGSGTTAIACKEMGRNFIGIEKEQKYVDIANKRLQNTTIGMF